MNRFLCLWVLMFSAIAGCESQLAGDLPKLFPAKGKLVLGGNGTAGAVRFQPVSPTEGFADLAIVGEAQSDGTFELSTIHAISQKRATGAPAGKYQVTFLPPMGDQTKSADAILPPRTLATTYTIEEKPTELLVDVGK